MKGTQKIKQLWEDIRQDPEAFFELRQLLFGAVIVVAILYGAFALYIEKKEKIKTKNISEKNRLTATLGGGELDSLMSTQLQKLQQQKVDLEEKTDLLRFKEQILREQYSSGSSSESFAKVIFTLLPLSPVDIENGFVQMNVLETRKHDYYEISPVELKGNLEYSEFLYYLQYLENRHEVGMIGDISLERLPREMFGDSDRIQFEVVLGRVQMRSR